MGQEKQDRGVTDVFKLTILGPGISYEKSIGHMQTLYLRGFVSIGFAYSYSSSFGSEASVGFYPATTLQYRYYYNSLKRKSKGKRTEMNSMNYLAGIDELLFTKVHLYYQDKTEDHWEAVNRIGIAWGIQRNYAKRFSIDANVGLGYLFTKHTYWDETGSPYTENQENLTLLGSVSIGFWLNKKK